MNNNNDRIQRSNYILLGLVILMLLYGVIYRFMSGDDSLYIFGIPSSRVRTRKRPLRKRPQAAMRPQTARAHCSKP